jgi:hypothetical protein
VTTVALRITDARIGTQAEAFMPCVPQMHAQANTQKLSSPYQKVSNMQQPMLCSRLATGCSSPGPVTDKSWARSGQYQLTLGPIVTEHEYAAFAAVLDPHPITLLKLEAPPASVTTTGVRLLWYALLWEQQPQDAVHCTQAT